MKAWLAAGIGLLVGFVLGVGGTLFGGAHVARLVFDAPVAPPRADDPIFGVGSTALHMGDPAAQEELRQALEKAGVPYREEHREGKAWLRWAGKDAAHVEAIRKSLEVPSMSVELKDPRLEAEFKAWLAGRGISAREVHRSGRLFIAWEGPSALFGEFMASRAAPCLKSAASDKRGVTC